MGYIGEIQIKNSEAQSIGSTAFCTCSTGSAVSAKEAEFLGFYLIPGATVFVKFLFENTAAASNISLNIGGTGAVPLRGKLDWMPGDILPCTFDGESWIISVGSKEDVKMTATVTNGLLEFIL